ncbi:LytTR family DNA-binding domain-containing protein [Flavobacteriales bacterium]|nr:LytTR family DNA-binding domain-containing protein [Flavobacteriales bacterium]
MTNVLIVEDEWSTAELLKELIESQKGYQVVETLERVDTAVQYLEANQSKLDIIFLDIHLADGESFHIFDETEVQVPVIFCTAYDQYLMKAFKHNGIEYILKPFRQSDIEEALAKFESLKFRFAPEKEQSQNYKLAQTFLVHYREQTIPVAVDQIALVFINQGITYLFNQKGDSYHISKTMDEMEQALPAEQFYRVNRQMILNRNAVKEVEPYFNRKVIVKLNVDLKEQVVVSRLKVSPFMKWLGQ